MVDMAKEEKGIQRGITLAFLATLAAFVLSYLTLPAFFAFPEPLDQRLAFALAAGVFPGLVLVAAVGMVSTTRRTSPEDIGGAAAGPPSPRLAVKSAFLQNTLEQTVIAAIAIAAYAALVSGPWLALVPATILLFGAGRIAFYRAYPGGAAARSFGMSLTLMPGLLLLLASAVMILVQIAQSWIFLP